MAWECLRAPLVGHFLLGRFASQEVGPDLTPPGPPPNTALPLLGFEQVEVFTISLPREAIPGLEGPLQLRGSSCFIILTRNP